MSMMPPRPPTQFLEARRGEIARVEEMAGRVHKVYGFIDVENSGEQIFDATFPVRFIEKPALSFGGELAHNQVLEDGAFPTVSVMVKSWVTEESADGIATHYLGATLIGVMLGHTELKGTIHWQLEGRALRNPLAAVTTVDTTL